jgi:signal transduction histidine kinase
VEAQTLGGFRTVLCVPMLREGALLGVIAMGRAEVCPFTDKQIELVTTFADQAVIAIENVRLVTELQARTDELARSVEELTALGQTTQAVSSSLELGQVLTTIAEQATTLCQADAGVIQEYQEAIGEFRISASWNASPAFVRGVHHAQVTLGKGAAGQSAATGKPVQIPDILAEPDYPFRDLLAQENYRAVLSVPMRRDGQVLGTVVLLRKSPGAFDEGQVHLLTTFANQTTLAIEHAHLYRDLREKGHELEAASRHKSEFLANMSHELRTPLNAIIGFSEVLLDPAMAVPDAERQQFLEDILSSGKHLLSLINDILDLSKVEAGRMELQFAPFNLPLAIESAITLIRERASRHGIAVSVMADAALGEIVADERKVRQILLNLLSNAVKFTPDGGRIEVSAGRAGDYVEVSVRDTGIGIALEDQATVFEEFRQVGGPRTQVLEGTGLGLALAKRFVDLHGGTIGVQSAVGQGTTFTVTLPLRRGPVR